MSQKRVVKKKVLKKKVATTAPGTPGRYRPPEPPPEPISAGSIILLVVALGLIAGVVILFLAPDLSGVDGYPYEPAKAGESPRNLLRELDDAITATYTESKPATLEFSEQELNTYLNQRLRKTQRGPFSSVSNVEGVFLELREDVAEIHLVRSLFGAPFVVSTTWDYFLSSGSYVVECKSSRIGRLRFAGAMFRPIMMPFLRMGKACNRELAALNDGSVRRIKLQPGKLIVEVK